MNRTVPARTMVVSRLPFMALYRIQGWWWCPPSSVALHPLWGTHTLCSRAHSSGALHVCEHISSAVTAMYPGSHHPPQPPLCSMRARPVPHCLLCYALGSPSSVGAHTALAVPDWRPRPWVQGRTAGSRVLALHLVLWVPELGPHTCQAGAFAWERSWDL